MATTVNLDRPERGLIQLAATLTAQNDTVTFQMPRTIAMSVQVEGLTTATVSLLGSNNGTDFYALPTAVSLTADGIRSVALADLGFLHYQLSMTVASNSATVTVIGMEPR